MHLAKGDRLPPALTFVVRSADVGIKLERIRRLLGRPLLDVDDRAVPARLILGQERSAGSVLSSTSHQAGVLISPTTSSHTCMTPGAVIEDARLARQDVEPFASGSRVMPAYRLFCSQRAYRDVVRSPCKACRRRASSRAAFLEQRLWGRGPRRFWSPRRVLVPSGSTSTVAVEGRAVKPRRSKRFHRRRQFRKDAKDGARRQKT